MFKGAWVLKVNTVCTGKNGDRREKLPLFTKDINCLIVMYKLEERYKNEGVAIRRLFGI